MTWNDVSVFQFQQLEKLKEDDAFDAMFKIVGILNNMTERQVDALSMAKFNELCQEAQFVYTEQLPSKTSKYLKINGRRYRFIPDIREIKVGGTGRYIETKHFQSSVIQNLHKIGASMIMPQKKTWFGWVDDEYLAQNHDMYAQDVLESPITEVYGMIVFFCKVYKQLIINSKDYLMEVMIQQNMNHLEAEKVVKDLCDYMDGFIK
jgi:hypothetical protein